MPMPPLPSGSISTWSPRTSDSGAALVNRSVCQRLSSDFSLSRETVSDLDSSFNGRPDAASVLRITRASRIPSVSKSRASSADSTERLSNDNSEPSVEINSESKFAGVSMPENVPLIASVPSSSFVSVFDAGCSSDFSRAWCNCGNRKR